MLNGRVGFKLLEHKCFIVVHQVLYHRQNSGLAVRVPCSMSGFVVDGMYAVVQTFVVSRCASKNQPLQPRLDQCFSVIIFELK